MPTTRTRTKVENKTNKVAEDEKQQARENSVDYGDEEDDEDSTHESGDEIRGKSILYEPEEAVKGKEIPEKHTKKAMMELETSLRRDALLELASALKTSRRSITKGTDHDRGRRQKEVLEVKAEENDNELRKPGSKEVFVKPRLRTPTRPPRSRSSSVDSTAPWRDASQASEPPRKLQKLPVPSPPPATTSKAKFPKHFDHKPAGSRWRKRPSDDERTPIELRCWKESGSKAVLQPRAPSAPPVLVPAKKPPGKVKLERHVEAEDL